MNQTRWTITIFAFLFLTTPLLGKDPVITICPVYSYGNFGGVAYYYAIRCTDGVPGNPLSWAGPPGSEKTPCTACFDAKLAFAKKSDHYDAEDMTKKNGAPTFVAPTILEGEMTNPLGKEFTLRIPEKTPPFKAQIKKTKRMLVHFLEIIPADTMQKSNLAAIGLELDEKPVDTDPVADVFHEDQHLWHFTVTIPNSIFVVQGQLITHK